MRRIRSVLYLHHAQDYNVRVIEIERVRFAVKIQKNEPTASNESVYVFAGLLMMAGGVCVGLLQRVNTTARGTRQTRYESYRGYGYGSRSPPGFQSRCVV